MGPKLNSPSELMLKTPLVVDLDGALVGSNLFVESIFAHFGREPSEPRKFMKALLRGKAALKSHISSTTPLDVSQLPFDEQVLSFIREAAASGTPVYLISENGEIYARAVTDHLGLFAGIIACSASENLSQPAKAQVIIETFGRGGFDYIGHGAADYPIWEAARQRLAARPSAAVRAKLGELGGAAILSKSTGREFRSWIKLLRMHQWAKNALVFVPLVTAQKFALPSMIAALTAFVAFSLAASAIYILNDLVDLDADRKHPTKKARPLAAGTVPTAAALYMAVLLLLAASGLAIPLPGEFAAVLAFYLLLTTAYSFWLKRKLLIDVIALALLYTSRVVGGAAAVTVPLSEWLLGFSILIFTSLALIKRYIELATRLDGELPDPTNRDYRKSDLSVIAAVAAGAAFNAVTVFALYISSDTVHRLYRRPDVLWLICPILMYWLSRILILAHRRAMDDDPIIFALKDRNSLVALGSIAAILLFAM
ncbi:UbiA family prenyltransferase [Bradyrhizobium sp. CB82]|uniref:UbiA family prenyltransferase n=1 Tax=Bradyrhizobium sp. CB82 TaxID=3039159 RepID=UPI0024B198A9|nr:UbiA family prenyltransferase [Bradyrhizobium sp. CB82]WFU38814.1 UbiA family prenyltransferase [Bradyrhizobium sp. CB82]